MQFMFTTISFQCVNSLFSSVVATKRVFGIIVLLTPLQQRLTQAEDTNVSIPSTFSNLIAEIRIRIWNYVAQQEDPITIDIAMPQHSIQNQELRTRIPSLLLTCCESRHEGLKHFSLCIERRFLSVRARRGVWINISKDEFRFGASSDASLMGPRFFQPDIPPFKFRPATLAKIRKLCFHMDDFDPEILLYFLTCRTNARNLTLIIRGRSSATADCDLMYLHTEILMLGDMDPNFRFADRAVQYVDSQGEVSRMVANPYCEECNGWNCHGWETPIPLAMEPPERRYSEFRRCASKRTLLL